MRRKQLDAALASLLAQILACAPLALAATKALMAKARLSASADLDRARGADLLPRGAERRGAGGNHSISSKTQTKLGHVVTFTKILIANRGEIAVRVIRTARSLGYQSVAVYSDADRGAPHVALADEAVHIGASAAVDSYLNVGSLLEAARKTSADAVHPGYGFLSENADFAQACQDAGLTFIGPPPSAMRAMGNKALAKRRMLAAGVPCAPGYFGDDQDDARLTQEAGKLGFPLLVKAVAGRRRAWHAPGALSQ